MHWAFGPWALIYGCNIDGDSLSRQRQNLQIFTLAGIQTAVFGNWKPIHEMLSYADHRTLTHWKLYVKSNVSSINYNSFYFECFDFIVLKISIFFQIYCQIMGAKTPLKKRRYIHRQSPIFLLLTKDFLLSTNANMATFYHLELSLSLFLSL